MKRKNNLIVTLADKNYVEQAKQLFSSIYFNSGWQGDYMLLSNQIPEKNLKWFRKKGIIVKKLKPLYQNKEWYQNLPKNVLSPTMSVKYHLFTPEFKRWDKIIYLDSDIIVRDSLNKLTKVKTFGAVQDMFIVKLRRQFTDEENLTKETKPVFKNLKQQYNLNQDCFNAGVFAFNTKIIDSQTLSKLKNLFQKYRQISKYSEQSILNLFFHKWESFPLAYKKVKLTIASKKPTLYLVSFQIRLYPENFFLL